MSRALSPLLLSQAEDVARWSLELGQPIPGWLVVALCVGSLILGALAYRRLEASMGSRVTLALLRATLIMLVLLAIGQPQWVARTELVEPDVVVVLLDRSASMTVADGVDGERQIERGELLARVVEEEQPWGTLGENHDIAWYAFAERAHRMDGPIDIDARDLSNEGTSIGRAVEDVLVHHAGQPIASIIVLSDGRSQAMDPNVVARLLERGIRVHTIALGSTDVGPDWRIVKVDAPRVALLQDEVPIRVELASPLLGSATVTLEDIETGLMLDRRKVTGGDEDVWLRASGDEPGNRQWRVRIESPDVDPVPANNQRDFDIEFVDRAVRVLYVERSPRWEFRYLRNLLIREPTFDTSTFLLSAGPGFAQEGDSPIARLPRTAEEWEVYDVVILGDIAPESLPHEQQRSILDHVAEGGAGLLWLAGSEHMPRSWADSALGTLLPMRDPDLVRVTTSPIHVQPTSDADRLGVFALRAQDATSAWAVLGSPETLWAAQSISQLIDPTRLKPTSSVLLERVGSRAGEGSSPLAIMMRYGAGQSLYLGIDEVWRWRRNRAARYFDQFYIPVVRSLARGRADRHAPMMLRLSPRPLRSGSPIDLSLQVRDQQLRERIGPTLPVRISDGSASTITTELQAGALGDRYVGRVELDVGRYELTPTAQPAGSGSTSFLFTVWDESDELLTTAVDHALLKSLSNQTGGTHSAYQEDGWRDLAVHVPSRDRITEHVKRRPIWDTPLAFGLIIGLMVAEWIGRRAIRLA